MELVASAKELLCPGDAEINSRDRLMLEVWRLAWPAITHMLLITLVFLVDRLVLGNYSADSLASLQISSVLVWTLYSIFTAFSAGTLALAGRAVGAGDRRQAARIALVSIAGAGAIGVVVAGLAVGLIAAALPSVFPHAGEEVLGDATAYLMIVLPTLPLSFSEATAAAALQASGDTRTPLFAATLANVANLVLSIVLVFGLLGFPELGIRGAAVGAAVAASLQAIILMTVLFSKRSPLPLRAVLVEGTVFDRATIRRLASVSVPAFLDKLAYNGGYVIFVAIIGLLGSAVMAANQALVSVEAICFLSADGFGIAAGALVAQKLGAKSELDAKRAARIAARLSVALLSTFGLVFLLIPRQLVSAFSDDPTIVALGVSPLYVAALAQPFMAYASVMRMALRGAGATRAVLAVTLVGTFFVRLPAAYVAAVVLDHGLVGIWIGSTLDWVFEAIVLAWLFRRGGWASKAV